MLAISSIFQFKLSVGASCATLVARGMLLVLLLLLIVPRNKTAVINRYKNVTYALEALSLNKCSEKENISFWQYYINMWLLSSLLETVQLQECKVVSRDSQFCQCRAHPNSLISTENSPILQLCGCQIVLRPVARARAGHTE